MRIRLKQKILVWAFLILTVCGLYHYYWGRHLYIVTAYCNCPICINVPKYYDGHFASGKHIRWGGIAADPKVPFGAQVELVPLLPQDWLAVFGLMKGRRDFTVEDRGGKIKGKHIDLFFPDSLGGHKAAKAWGKRYLRLKINGRWAD